MTDKLDVDALNAIRELFVSQKWDPVWIARLDAIVAALAALEKERDELRAWSAVVEERAQRRKADIENLQAQLAQKEKELRKRGDAAYIQYSEAMRAYRCLGADAKMSSGKFGRDELTAHQIAQEWLGKHKAFHEAASALRQSVPASHEAGECENCQGDHDEGTSCQMWRKTCRRCKAKRGYCGCKDVAGFLSEQPAASSGEAGEAGK